MVENFSHSQCDLQMWLCEGQFEVVSQRKEELCVCVCWGDSNTDMMVRMRPLTVMCPHFFDTDM